MEYLLGALVTLFSVVVLNKMFLKQVKRSSQMSMPVSQSYLHKFLSGYGSSDVEAAQETQSSKYISKQSVKVMIVEGEAYWIQNNQLYVAQYKDGEVDDLGAEKVDTISMDSVQLEKTMFIVEKLTEGKNDSSGSGK
jgi:hypothetical protein